MRDRSVGKTQRGRSSPKARLRASVGSSPESVNPETEAPQDPPFGGTDLSSPPRYLPSVRIVLPRLSPQGAPGSSPAPHGSDFSRRPGLSTRAAFHLRGEPVVPPVSPLLLLAP